MSSPKLFQPMKVGTSPLKHRVALAPMTRYRASRKEHVPTIPLMEAYYSQRGSRPGTLLVTEATFIAPQAAGYDNAPGIWNEAQIKAWRKITDAVHAKGSFIYVQLWALGRSARPEILKEDGFDHVAPSPIAAGEAYSVPRELTTHEIQEYIQWYAEAAKNAVKAGFDGVEIHGANGYLIDQFLQDISNSRKDDYGGSIEARSKFGLQVVDAVVKAIGQEKTALRISPWSRFQNMKMEDPIPQFSHFVSTVAHRYPDFAYLHVVETYEEGESNDFLRHIWKPRPFISCTGYDAKTALERAEKGVNELVAFGKWFISNPDLPDRIEKGIPFTPFDPSTFHTRAHEKGTERGYIDYPFANERDENA
ncbi:NADH:flavin oxidoreductase/NADH oxidase [Agrocybe pediades]|nr:NADH:flavin oxidoreductase/NADH oxidase [Agrocybe pediades]